MTKQAAENESFFEGIDVESLEESLLTVDVAEGENVAEIIKEEVSGGGEPDKPVESTDDESKRISEEKSKVEKKAEENLIVVDTTGKEEITEQQKAAEEKEKKEKEEKEKGSASDSKSQSPVYLHAASLQENGVLPDFDLKELEKLKPGEAILKINEHIQSQITESIEEGINVFKEGIGAKALSLVDAVEKGVPFEDAARNYTLEQQFGNITVKALEDNVDLQKAVYTDLLNMKGFSDTKITKLVAIAEEKEDLLLESTDSLVEIQGMIKTENTEQLRVATEKKEEAAEKNTKLKATIKTTVAGIKEILPGVAVTDGEKKELLKQMTTPVRYIDRGNGVKTPVSRAMDLRSKDILAWELRLNYLINKGFFEPDLDNPKLKTFMASAETSSTAKLIAKMDGDKPTGGGNPDVVVEDEKKVEQKELGGFTFPQDI